MNELSAIFEKYQKYLVLALRNPLVRKLIGADYMLPKDKIIVGVHPSGITYLEGFRNGRYVVTSKFQSRPFIAEKLHSIISILKYLPAIPALMGSPVPAFALTVDTFTASTADTSMVKNATTYAAARGATAAGTVRAATGTEYYLYNAKGAPSDYYVERIFLSFATGATIPSGNAVSAASLDLVEGSFDNHASNTCMITKATPADDTSYVAEDFDQVQDTSFGFASFPGINTAFTITVNATGQADIAVGSGNTKWSIRMSQDVSNTEPTTNDNAAIRAADHGTPSSRPTLSVTHDVAPAGGGISGYKSLLGVGQA